MKWSKKGSFATLNLRMLLPRPEKKLLIEWLDCLVNSQDSTRAEQWHRCLAKLEQPVGLGYLPQPMEFAEPRPVAEQIAIFAPVASCTATVPKSRILEPLQIPGLSVMPGLPVIPGLPVML